MNSKRKHISLPLTQKLEILDKLKEGKSPTEVSVEYNIGRGTVYDVKKNEDKLRYYTSQADSNLTKRKNITKGEKNKLDVALYRWFIQQRSKGLPLSGTIIKEKALLFNQKLGGDDQFVASEGWLSNWKKRFGIRQLTITGESRSANEVSAEEFKRIFDKLIEEDNLSPAQVYLQCRRNWLLCKNVAIKNSCCQV